MDVAATWSLFDELAAEVRRRVESAGPQGRERGTRSGQYVLDLAADDAVVPMLLDAGFGVMSEESGRHEPQRSVCVVVDPVDGSTNAARGLPCWATSLCAVDAEGPWVATVVDHSRAITYRAARGLGATRTAGDGAPESITVAAAVPLSDAVVAVNGRSASWPAARQFRALGSAAIELCLVAEGALDGYLNLDGDSHGSWDYLGAFLVLTEAGGVAGDAQGRDLVTLDPDARRCIIGASGPVMLDTLSAPMGVEQ